VVGLLFQITRCNPRFCYPVVSILFVVFVVLNVLRSHTTTLPSDKFTVGLIQMHCSPDPDENLQRACARVREAAGKGAQMVCLPELFRTQYFCQREDAALFELAEPGPGPPTYALASIAHEASILIVASVF
jgi:N-carbamoylputrescine amidase